MRFEGTEAKIVRCFHELWITMQANFSFMRGEVSCMFLSDSSDRRSVFLTDGRARAAGLTAGPIATF